MEKQVVALNTCQYHGNHCTISRTHYQNWQRTGGGKAEKLTGEKCRFKYCLRFCSA